MKKIFTAIASCCLLTVISCSSDKTNPIAGRWNVVAYTDPFKATIEPTAVSTDEIYTLRLQNTGTFSITTDCNTISGEYTVTGKQLQFDNLSATEMACDREIAERSFKRQLPMVDSYDLPNDSTLDLLGKQGNILIKLVKCRDL